MACPCKVQKNLINSRFNYDSRKQIYLDYNATTEPDRELLGEYQNLSLSSWGHPMSPHGTGSEALKVSEKAQTLLDDIFSADFYSHFPSTGTEAVLKGLFFCQSLSERRRQAFHYYPSGICHPSVFQALEALKLPYTAVPVDPEGVMDLSALSASPEAERPVLIYSAVNHETGGLEKPETLYQYAHFRKGLDLCDAVQAFTRMDEAFWLPFCDLFFLSGHKFHVPRGIALLGLKKEAFREIEETLPDSTNPALQMVLVKGIGKYQQRRKEIQSRLAVQEKEAVHYWKKMNLPFRMESPVNKVPGVLNISLEVPEMDMEELFLFLAQNHLCISRFCACTGSVDGKSSILEGMGRPAERSSRSLRISGGAHTATQDWISAGRIICDYLKDPAGKSGS